MVNSLATKNTTNNNVSIQHPSLGPKPKFYHTNRPFFNIAHMVNSLNELNDYLNRGANAIETDVYFSSNATPVYTFHGKSNCDCFRRCGERERIDIFFERIRLLTTPSSPVFDKRLLLIILDLKLLRISHSAKASAGQQLASLLLSHLYNMTTRDNSPDGSRLRAVISISHVFDYDFVLGFVNEIESHGRDFLLADKIGWDVGMNDPLFAIESMWKRLDMVVNIWQGDGRSNCMTPFYNLGRLTQIVKRRDNPSFFAIKNYIRKVYQWTVDLTVNIRTAFRSDVDAIITNHPERVCNVMRESEFASRYRMATYEDSPWERIWTRPTRPQTSSMLTKPTLGLKLVNSAGDMLDSMTRFMVDALRSQTLLRYLFLSQNNSVVNETRDWPKTLVFR
ncbi:hypothetical protein HUG17_9970 [Dermatophagoides farinae]|uniref:Uncharacterized protein n=1 Tax=Dermatophagoides farinae TaxID=6954 RepID=A0A9D4P415_DERFA|nr:hypothetical protein HUG17_9970 [Dermatophagoides farinae]